MNNAYRNIARIAGEAERHGMFDEAADVWRKSLSIARAADIAWINIRIDFCVNAALRDWGR
ncbi:ANR family transcriptional regulator [Serratia marcescens]|uniref:ANR family transcriptional regulator n=1 Tax=Serratia marcescens TaxID=615 RepID=A0ABD5IP69_SERMA|nr:ANR family transcriptional regulator [Serratia marcescens]MDX7085927.1 ANR family transcriptional regulator [Serratia marcescens]